MNYSRLSLIVARIGDGGEDPKTGRRKILSMITSIWPVFVSLSSFLETHTRVLRTQNIMHIFNRIFSVRNITFLHARSMWEKLQLSKLSDEKYKCKCKVVHLWCLIFVNKKIIFNFKSW